MNDLGSFFQLFQSSAQAPTLGMMIMALLYAFIAGQIVAWAYTWSHSGVSYSRAYVQSLVIIAVVIALIMMIVGTNVVVAFGLFGAFAVIRFRNVLKDTRDTAFIFMELAVGLGAGTWNFLPLTIGTAVFVMVVMYLSMTSFGSRQLHDALLRFEAPKEQGDLIARIMSRHCLKTSLISHRSEFEKPLEDFSYRLMLRDPGRSNEFIEELKSIEGVSGVSLLLQGDQAEV